MGLAARKLRMTAPAAGGLTTIAEDTFTRANSTSLGSTEVGSFAWTEHSGNLEIVSNALEAVLVTGVDNRATFDAGVADCTLTANVRTASSTDRTAMSVILRYVNSTNLWWIDVNDFPPASGGSTALNLFKFVAGTPTTVGTYAAGFGANETHEIVVEMSGSDYTVYLNGVARITATDASHNTATRYGLRVYTHPTLYDDGTSGLLDIKVEA